MKILVTGGAGYIGSITAKKLQEEGNEVVVFDNLSNGKKEYVLSKLVVGDLTDKNSFSQLEKENFDGVIHFAALALAGESMHKPYEYFHNNILGGLNLLEFMRSKNIKHIIFSSTCAVYGYSKNLPVTENEEKKPESVYGESKLMFEKMLEWYDKIYGIKYINLRYFNAAGAALDASLGEDHNPETHIIPIAIQAALGARDYFELFGEDYPTKDGSCIRDYIHVEDLAIGHVLALKKLIENGKSGSYNLGTGKSYSNKEVIDMVKKISGVDFKVEVKERRPGDPSAIFADNSKITKELGFQPQHSNLETIVKTAWKWHCQKVDSSK